MSATERGDRAAVLDHDQIEKVTAAGEADGHELLGPALVSKVTDAILPELREWQSRPLDAVYPILYLDAIIVKVRSDHQVINKAVHIALGVDVDGFKHVLGMWIQREEGAKFWLGV